MIRKIISTIVAFILVCCIYNFDSKSIFMYSNVSAVTLEYNGNNDLFIVSPKCHNGYGTIKIDALNKDKITSYIEIPEYITILNETKKYKITEIESNVFQGNTIIETIRIPSSISIDANAFKNCTNLKTVEFYEDEVTDGTISIGANAFDGCSSLEDIIFDGNTESKVEYIGGNALKDTPWLNNAFNIENNSYVEGNAYRKYLAINDWLLDYMSPTNSRYLEIPSYIHNLPDELFSNGNDKYEYITDIVLSADMDYIGENSLENTGWYKCWYEEKYKKISESMTNSDFEEYLSEKIDDFDFMYLALNDLYNNPKYIYSCSLKAINMIDAIQSIENNEILYCKINNISFPNTVQGLHTKLFYNNQFIKTVIIPDQVKRISKSCFSGCSNLTTINGMNKVEYIDDQAFSSCNRLKEVYLPNTIKKIGSQAFSNCNDLTTILLDNMDSYGINLKISSNTFDGNENITNVKLLNSNSNFEKTDFENLKSTELDIENFFVSDGENSDTIYCFISTTDTKYVFQSQLTSALQNSIFMQNIVDECIQDTILNDFNLTPQIIEQLTDVEKVVLIDTWRRNNIIYGYLSLNGSIIAGQSIEGCILKNYGVCAGFARFANKLSEALGLSSCYVRGGNEEDKFIHAWNIVYISDSYNDDGSSLNGWYHWDIGWNKTLLVSSSTIINRNAHHYFEIEYGNSLVNSLPDKECLIQDYPLYNIKINTYNGINISNISIGRYLNIDNNEEFYSLAEALGEDISPVFSNFDLLQNDYCIRLILEDKEYPIPIDLNDIEENDIIGHFKEFKYSIKKSSLNNNQIQLNLTNNTDKKLFDVDFKENILNSNNTYVIKTSYELDGQNYDLDEFNITSDTKQISVPLIDDANYKLELYVNDICINIIDNFDSSFNIHDKANVYDNSEYVLPYTIYYTPLTDNINPKIQWSTYVDGDVSLDGNLASNDLLCLKQYLLGFYSFIQTGANSSISINNGKTENDANIEANNLTINGNMTSKGKLELFSHGGNINGELNANESYISSGINHKSVGNDTTGVELLLNDDEITQIYFSTEITEEDVIIYDSNPNIEKDNLELNTNIICNDNLNITANNSLNLNSAIKSIGDISIVGDVKNTHNSIIYSSQGNIIIDGKDINYNGIIYAPQGKVTIIGTYNVNIRGTIIADEIEIITPNLNFDIANNYNNDYLLDDLQLFLADMIYDGQLKTNDFLKMKRILLGLL